MIYNVSNSQNSEVYLKSTHVEQKKESLKTTSRVQSAARTPFKNLLKAFKHMALAVIKSPVALFRSAILAMRCKKSSSSFLAKWSWKTVKAHCHQVKVLLKPKQTSPASPGPSISPAPVIPEIKKPLLPTPEPKNEPEPVHPIAPIKPPVVQPITKNPILGPFAEKIERLRREKKEDPSLVKDSDHRLERKAAKAEFACMVKGNDCMESTGKGVHGSQFVKSVKDKRLGVFKPIPVTEAKPFFFQQKAYLNKGTVAEAAAERASYILAKELNNPYLTVPAVKIMDLNGKKGSFAVYEKGKPADKIIREIDQKATYSIEELNIFQIFIILDYLLGNLDRHEENWLADWDGKTLKAIYPIDNANTFPTHKPSWYNFNAAKNVYRWQRLRLAGIPFTPEMRKFINKTIIDGNLQRIIQKINEDEQIRSCYPEGFLQGDPKKDFEFRTLKLRQLLLDYDNLAPNQLAPH